MKNFLSSIVEYFRSSKAELEKVTWPTRQDTIRYTIIVIVTCVSAALLFAAVDWALQKGVQVIVTRNSTTEQTNQTQTTPDVVPTVETSGTNNGGITVTTSPVTSTK